MNNTEKALRLEIRKMVKETLSELDMETTPKPLKLKGGLSKQTLGGVSSMRYAEDFIEAIKKLPTDQKKSAAIAYVLASIGMTPDEFRDSVSQIKNKLGTYKSQTVQSKKNV